MALAPSTQANSAAAPAGDFVLILSCPDRPGIVHAVSGFLVRHGGNILESQQFGDQLVGRFFMRIDFVVSDDVDAPTLRADFEAVAGEFAMEFDLWDAKAPYRTLIMVSKHLHCLNDLLFRASTGSVQIAIPVVVSNHPDAEALVRSYGLDFRHIPVTPDTKADAEDELLRLVDDLDIHLVVLARYMQVLSDDACRHLSGRAINIHHSFLPAFAGAIVCVDSPDTRRFLGIVTRRDLLGAIDREVLQSSRLVARVRTFSEGEGEGEMDYFELPEKHRMIELDTPPALEVER